MNENFRLVIDTSSPCIFVAVVKDKKIFKKKFVCKTGSSEHIVGLVDGVLKRARLELKDIGVICVCVGPGSFTGIRVGVVVAKAFAEITGAKVLPVTTFEIISYNQPKGCVAVVHSNKDKFYNSKGGFGELAEILLEKGEFVCSRNEKQFFKNFIDLSNGQNFVDVNKLEPYYVKLSQAEENVKK